MAYIMNTVTLTQFRAIGSVCRTLVLANTFCFVVIIWIFLFSGLTVSKRKPCLTLKSHSHRALPAKSKKLLRDSNLQTISFGSVKKLVDKEAL